MANQMKKNMEHEMETAVIERLDDGSRFLVCLWYRVPQLTSTNIGN